jgi:hypothetical protein
VQEKASSEAFVVAKAQVEIKSETAH